jgi:hypothetical protein
MNDGPKWDKYLPLVEFSYNKSYQELIKMSPFEALYGRPYHIPLSWSESGDRGRREGEAGSYKYIDCPVPLKELQWKKMSSLRVWSWWSHIPSGFSNERCTSIWHQRGSSLLQCWSVSHPWEVWASGIPSGTISKTVRCSQRISRIPTQRMSGVTD